MACVCKEPATLVCQPPTSYYCLPAGLKLVQPPAPEPVKEVKPKKEAPKPKEEAKCDVLLPKKATMIHFIKETKVWEGKPDAANIKFKKAMVPTALNVGETLEVIFKNKPDGWALTEVIELGDGLWERAFTVEYGSGDAKARLDSLGWTEKRGKEQAPVWVVVHKVEKKPDA